MLSISKQAFYNITRQYSKTICKVLETFSVVLSPIQSVYQGHGPSYYQTHVIKSSIIQGFLDIQKNKKQCTLYCKLQKYSE